MSTWDSREGSDRDRPRARRDANYAAARQMARAVAEREQGRRRLNATTVGVSFASVVAAGIVVAVLPGATHASVTGSSSGNSSSNSSNSGSSGSSGSSSSGSSSSNSDSDSGTLQQPASAPQVVGGGGAVSSGGT